MKRLTALLGLLGVVVCMAAALVVWFTGSRLSQANERVFDGIDKFLTASRDRVLGAQTRVQESKITTNDVRQGVERWVRTEATEHLVSQLALEKKAEELASGLRQADQWLEVSGASLQFVQQAMEIAGSLVPSADAANVDALLERMGAVRGQLRQSTETVDAIRQRLATTAGGETLAERIEHVAQLTLRVLATLGELDSRLGEFANGLVVTQARAQFLKTQTHAYIVAAQICGVLLMAWMAAGQVSLWRHGWNH